MSENPKDGEAVSIIINPGSGPVDGETTQENATLNISEFMKDVSRVRPGLLVSWDGNIADQGNGRWLATILVKRRPVEIEMPGLPLEKVRYLNESQIIWNFPRVYVNGSSWVWKWAIKAALPERQTGG